ncbi:molybdenum cofactor guanylyltransferase [Desulfobulbus rhabdoformis]|uniref:molybdenum cofactor guanylyltransferase n=1 Tax=Desulfobulbus rhabdoformis TaxID=34032 RepID=UPI001966582A|nr:molybdenum cofactor guanylyltransferase [Desulfobulbus rhabdoformis]MBM9614338.1 molybdenum cofactor guanylyltransferase [Desulfobulbus rhabdoformis]
MDTTQQTLTPVWGCVLIGGKSSRMGTPKHLIVQDGQTWVERTVNMLRRRFDQVVIAGAGEVPSSLASSPRIEDAAGIGGPLAGILAAFRAYPQVSWLVVACDQPDISFEAIDWLLSCRATGVLAVLPDIAGTGRVEPLLAYYDRNIALILEAMAAQGHRRMNRLQTISGVKTPTPPSNLHDSWHNINTPIDLAQSQGHLE